jgi:filamentous hemagglutinin family protein
VTSATAAAANAAIISAQQAAQATQQSMNSLTRATQALQAMQAAQTAAHNLAASTPSNVPNGLSSGGLVPDSGLAGPGVANPVSSWTGVSTPTQSTSGNQTLVTVVQTQPNAIANWSSFNVGTNTLVYFNQSAGNTASGNNWIILNRVTDPSGVPSQILGQIRAEGAVYLLNANGIVFGGGSQINVQTLLASSLNLFSNTFGNANTPGTAAYRFLNGGIGDGTSAILLTSLAPVPGTAGPGNITVEPGASITVGTNGLALLAAPNVTNNGSITAPSGQVALVAGIGVSYRTSTNVGSGAVATTNLTFASYGNWVNASGADITPVGSVVNNGLIYTPSGNITLVGGAVAQNGVAITTTSAAQAGSIIVNSDYEASLSNATFYTGAVTFGPQAVTAVLPDPSSPPVKNDPTSLAPWQSVSAPGGFTVAPPVGQGPGFIAVNGAAIDFQGGTLVYAPGQGLSVTATVLPDPRFALPAADGRILIENGAVLDVSGIANITLPASYYVQQIILAGNELADSPLQQNGFLYGRTVSVNLALSGTNTETGETWVGTPIANLASYTNQLNNSISMLLKNGGAISLVGNEVVAETGSVVNLMGGYIHYLGGTINTTELIGSDGRIYNIGSANPNITYTGIAGEFAVEHNVSGKPDPSITQYYSSPLLSGSYYQPEYIQGGNGGTLSITVGSVNDPLRTSTGQLTIPDSGAFVFDATLLAGALAGEMQVAGHNLPTAGSFTFVGVEPIEIGSANTLSGTGLAALAPPAGFGFSSPLLASPGSAYAAQNVISSTVLDNAQLASITLTAGSGSAGSTASGGVLAPQPVTEDSGAVLAVQPLGSITLNAGTATINGTLTARGGSITINTAPGALVPDNIVVASGAVLDVSGFFINDQSLAPGTLSPALALPVNAGTIALVVPPATSQSSATGTLPPATATDLSGNITLAAGSLLNLQGGGHVNASGQLVTSNGVPVGSGGNLTLETYAGLGTPLTQGLPPLLRGVLTLDGTIEALGFSGGGTLTLEQPAFQVGGNPATAGSAYYFNPAQWGALGFGSFVLTSIEGTVVPAGAVVTLQHQNLIPNAAVLSAPSGANPAAYAAAGLLVGTQRSPTNLTISAGQETLEQALQTTTADDSAIVGLGAQILGDPGASISISSTMALTMLGTIRAPGGTVSLAVNVPFTSGGVQATITPAGPLYLGPQSVIDVSGTVVMNPVPQTLSAVARPSYTTKKVLAGGTINLADDETAILVAPGAILNVSGTAGTLNVPQLVPGGPLGGQQLALVPTPQWSSAGAININGEMGLLFEGTLKGQGGAPQAAGAILTVTVDDPSSNALFNSINPILILVEDTAQAITASGATFDFSTFVPTTKPYSNASEQINPNIPAGVLLLGADSLNGSGIGSLVLNGRGGFAGQVSLTLGQSIVYNNGGYLIAANAGNFTWSGNPIQPGLAGGTTDGASLTLNAPYVSLVGVTVSGGGEQPSPGTATDPP